MAQEITTENASASQPKQITQEQLIALNEEVRDLKSRAAELNGDAGAAVKDAVKDYGLHRLAFKTSSKLTTLSPEAAQEALRMIILYSEMLGITAQENLFEEDAMPKAQSTVVDIESAQPAHA